MTQLERRLAKLEAELTPAESKIHVVFTDGDEPHEMPPDYKEGDKVIVVSWVSPDEENPET